MKISAKHFNAISTIARNEVPTEHQQSIIRYVSGVSNVYTAGFNLFAVNHVWKREKVNASIDRTWMNVNFANFFCVQCCSLSSSFALHHIWVESSTENCTYHLHVVTILVICLGNQIRVSRIHKNKHVENINFQRNISRTFLFILSTIWLDCVNFQVKIFF